MEEKLEFKVEIGHCKHTNDFTIWIKLSDIGVASSSHCYKECGLTGMYSELTIYNLTPENILEIGQKIIDKAYKIKPELIIHPAELHPVVAALG